LSAALDLFISGLGDLTAHTYPPQIIVNINNAASEASQAKARLQKLLSDISIWALNQNTPNKELIFSFLLGFALLYIPIFWHMNPITGSPATVAITAVPASATGSTNITASTTTTDLATTLVIYPTDTATLLDQQLFDKQLKLDVGLDSVVTLAKDDTNIVFWIAPLTLVLQIKYRLNPTVSESRALSIDFSFNASHRSSL
jgi:hypothetical protein